MTDSKKTDDGGSAYPLPVHLSLEGDEHIAYPGMSLRAHLAGQALPGLIQGYAVAYGSPTNDIAEICKEAVNFADEMILALKAGG